MLERLLCCLLGCLSERLKPLRPSGAVYLFPARPAHAATSPCKTEVREDHVFDWHSLATFRVHFFFHNVYVVYRVLQHISDV